MQRQQRATWLVLLCLASTVGSLSRAQVQAEQDTKPERSAKTVGIEARRKAFAEEKRLLRLFADTLEQVRSNYLDSQVTERELIEAAIQGMVSKLDPYSNYIPPGQVEQFRRDVDREFGGIGIQVAKRNGQLQIISPLVGTPADRAGLRAGDWILKIGETSTKDLTLDAAITLMKGELGSEVTITVLHPNQEETETVTLKREQIQLPTVTGVQRKDNQQWDFFCDTSRNDGEQKVAYVRISAFGRGTAQELSGVLQQLVAEPMQALILDLRFNPGGLLSEAIQVSDLFLREGEIVSAKGRGTPRQTWDAQADNTLLPAELPMVILVNRFSASASEVVSACLQDQQIATIVGERTWGKGSVQNVIELEGGKSILKLTTGSYQRPSGENIHRLPDAAEEDAWGVKPDPNGMVPLDVNETIQLDAHLRRQAFLAASDASNDSGDEPQFTDRQLQKALELIDQQLP